MQIAGIYEDPSRCEQVFPVTQKIDYALNGFILSNSEVFRFPEFTSIGLKHIINISCNGDMVLVCNSLGEVFGWGDDIFGLLGQGKQVYHSPLQVKSLKNIEKCGIGFQHAAVIDWNGLLYSWGTGVIDSETPQVVQSAKNYKSVDVVCGATFTCIRTDGCYIFIYGEIGKNHMAKGSLSPRKSASLIKKDKGPYSHPKLDSQTVVQVLGCTEYIAVVLENGEVCVFDNCMQLHRLNTFGNNIESIVGNDNLIWGLTENRIFAWRKTESNGGLFECPAKTWENSEYSTSENCEIWQWGDKFLIVSNETQVFSKISKGNGLKIFIDKDYIISPLDSPCIGTSLEKFSPRASFESLQRLYPKGNNEKLIEKILKCRLEFSNRSTLLDAFKSLIHPIVKSSISKIKIFTDMKKAYFTYMNCLRIANTMRKVLRNKEANRFFYWKNLMKSEKFMKWKHLQVNQIFSKNYQVFRDNLLCRFLQLLELKAVGNKKEGLCRIKMVWIRCANREAALRKCLRRASNFTVSLYFADWKEKMLRLLQRKNMMIKLEKVLKNKKNYWLFENLRKIIYGKKKYSKACEDGVTKLDHLLNFFDLKLRLKSLQKLQSCTFIRKQNSIISFSNFPRILSVPLTKVLSKRLVHFFELLHNKSQKKDPPKLAVCLVKIVKKRNKFILKNILTDIFYRQRSLAKLNVFIMRKLKQVIVEIKKKAVISASQTFTSFCLVLNSFSSRNEFLLKLQGFRMLKQYIGHPGDSYINRYYEDFMLRSLEQSSGSSTPESQKFPYLLSINPPHLKKSESSLTTLQLHNLKSEKFATSNNSPKSCFIRDELTEFQSGELVKYQKYLIMKKKLEMIQEDSGSENDKKNGNKKVKNLRSYKRKQKNIVVKPPWRPSSISANFVYEKKKTSALTKGMKYYENLLNKQERIHLINRENIGKTVAFQKQEFKTGTFNFNSKLALSPLLYNQDSDSTTMYISSNNLIDIGLGSFLIEKVFKKTMKFQIAYVFKRLSQLYHRKVLPKPSWRIGVLKIGFERLRTLLKKRFLRLILKTAIN